MNKSRNNFVIPKLTIIVPYSLVKYYDRIVILFGTIKIVSRIRTSLRIYYKSIYCTMKNAS